MQPGVDSNAFGVDVSVYNGTPDWERGAGAGKHFAYMRVSEGPTYPDPMFSYNGQQTKCAGPHRGAYHTAVPGSMSANVAADAPHQGAHFLAVVDQNGGIQGYDMPPALDFQLNPCHLAGAALVEWVLHWLEDVEAAVRNPAQKPVLYGSPAFLVGLGGAWSGFPPLASG